MPFDISGAKKAGYSDAEIADHLATSSRFDAKRARSSGYSDAEIIGHLSSSSEPAKIGADAFPDQLRRELAGESWGGRNLAGAGTALSGMYEGAKQLFGQGDERQIQAIKTIEAASPVGALVGNAALAAVPFGMAGQSLKAAAGVGAGLGALSPVAGDQNIANVAAGKATNAAIYAGAGAAGQAVANQAAKVVGSRMAKLAADKARNAPMDRTLQDAIDAGLVVPPSSVKPSLANNLSESVAGKIATAQTASNRNSKIIDDMARRSVGLGKDAPLTSESMRAIRKMAYQDGYEPIASLGDVHTDNFFRSTIDRLANKYAGVARSFPGATDDTVSNLANTFKVGKFDAGDALQASQFLRDKATKAFRAGENDVGKAAKDIAKAIEDQIERGLSQNIGGATTMNPVRLPSGQTVYMSGAEMLQNFRGARQLMAKAHTVEDAIIEGGGTINPRKLGQRAQAGKPLSGELETIGNFANNFPRATQPATMVAGPGVSKMGYYASLMAGGGGAAVGGPVGAIVGAAAPMAVPAAARAALLSGRVQRGLVPQYQPGAGTVALSAFASSPAAAGGSVSSADAVRRAMSERKPAEIRDLSQLARIGR